MMIPSVLSFMTVGYSPQFGSTTPHPKLANGTKPNVVIFFADVSMDGGIVDGWIVSPS